MLEDVHARLAGVVIECLPFAEFIGRYDGPGTLFYLDPPYWNCETDHGKGVFGQQDFEVLRDRLRAIEGHFIMSLNDVPEVREMFSEFDIEEVKTTYTISKGEAQGGRKEVVISG